MASRRKQTAASTPGTATEIHAGAPQGTPQGTVPTRDWTAFADSLPSVLQPVAVLIVGLVRAFVPLFRGAWRALKGLGRVGWSIIALLAPLFSWAGSKWLQWYIMSYVKKVTKFLSWAVWILGFLPKGGTGPGAAAGGTTAG